MMSPITTYIIVENLMAQDVNLMPFSFKRILYTIEYIMDKGKDKLE